MADTVHPRRAQALVGSYAQPRQPSTLRCLTSAEMDAAGFVRNARKYVQYIYLQNDNLPNPWDSVPSYFGDLLAALE